MNQRVGKYWKATFMSGSNKAFFQPSNINFSCPVRAIKRKDMSQGYKVKYSFPSSSKMQTESLHQLEKGHGPGKCNATPLPTCFLQFVVRNHSAPYQKLSSALQVVVDGDLLMGKQRLTEDSIIKGKIASQLNSWEVIFPIFPGISISLRFETLDVCSVWPRILSE